ECVSVVNSRPLSSPRSVVVERVCACTYVYANFNDGDCYTAAVSTENLICCAGPKLQLLRACRLFPVGARSCLFVTEHQIQSGVMSVTDAERVADAEICTTMPVAGTRRSSVSCRDDEPR
ncbi:unnamed protein product, partial [Ectocarpus sp. 8 AP-2014]